MKRTIIFLTLFCCNTIITHGQELNPGTLEVTGTSSIQVPPDQTTIRLRVSAIRMLYADALEDLDGKMKNLSSKLTRAGFEKKEIRTQDFNVRKNTVYRKGSQVDSGFVASQYVVLEFPYDKKQLGHAIDAIGASATGADMQIAFGLSDDKANRVRTELIRAAIRDAKLQANTIADEANIELIRILRIRYGEESMPSPGTVYRTAARAEQGSTWDIEARDIDLGETIGIIWNIR